MTDETHRLNTRPTASEGDVERVARQAVYDMLMAGVGYHGRDEYAVAILTGQLDHDDRVDGAILGARAAIAALQPAPKEAAEGLAVELEAADYEYRGPFGREKHRILPPDLFDRILTALRAQPSIEAVEAKARELCAANFAAEGCEGEFGSVDDCWFAFVDEALAALQSPPPADRAEALERENERLTVAHVRAAAYGIKRVAQLERALQPFADFADPHEQVPEEMHITPGSYLAKRQLTMGDCYRARTALNPESNHAE